jgi:hypothetical protein
MNRYKGSGYWDMVRISNDETEYPSNMGEKWCDTEERLLLEELNNNIDIETIAQNHKRTIGGINSRRQYLAYRMYLQNLSIEEITKRTKLDYSCIQQTIQKKDKHQIKKHTTKVIDNVFISINKNDYIGLQNDVHKMKIDIAEIKNTLDELVEMMKAVYEFEDT